MEQVKNFNDTVFAEDVVTENDNIICSPYTKYPKRNNSETKVSSKASSSKASSSKASFSKTSKKIKQKKYENFSFNLFGDEIEVCFHDMVYSDEDNKRWIFGNSNFAEQVINLSTKKPSGNLLTPEQIKQTFIHECVHIMLESGQYYDQSYDEGLVEWLAKCINMMFFSNTTLAKHF